MDSGATNHVTAELSNLSIQNGYKGNEKLTVGNGSQLVISHIGSTFIPIQSSVKNSRSLILKNVLWVPQITKNLLCLSQLTKDNDVIVVFDKDCCLVKDKNMRTVLLQGTLMEGL